MDYKLSLYAVGFFLSFPFSVSLTIVIRIKPRNDMNEWQQITPSNFFCYLNRILFHYEHDRSRPIFKWIDSYPLICINSTKISLNNLVGVIFKVYRMIQMVKEVITLIKCLEEHTVGSSYVNIRKAEIKNIYAELKACFALISCMLKKLKKETAGFRIWYVFISVQVDLHLKILSENINSCPMLLYPHVDRLRAFLYKNVFRSVFA